MTQRIVTAAALALWLTTAQVAHALNTWGTDMSDLWFNPNESGWGVNVVHQGDTVFATFFVYGADSRTRWYVAPALTYSPGSGGAYVFSGALFETQGPYLGAATFNPAAVTNRQVGTATLTFALIYEGTLNYTVDGVAVAKTIQRQTFRRSEPSGHYVGAVISAVSGCIGATTSRNTGQFSVALNPLPSNSIAINAVLDNGARCSYSGTYFQDGRMGSISGTFACTGNTPTSGTFEAGEIEAGNDVIVVRYVARYGTCTEEGRIGGMRL